MWPEVAVQWHGHGQPPARPDIALPQTVVTTVQVLSRITSHLVLASTSLECFALTLHTCISGGYTQPFSEMFLMFGLRIPLEYIVCQRAILRHRSRGRRLAYVLPLYGCIIVFLNKGTSLKFMVQVCQGLCAKLEWVAGLVPGFWGSHGCSRCLPKLGVSQQEQATSNSSAGCRRSVPM